MLDAALLSSLVSAGDAPFVEVDRPHLFEARQMQALSLAVHIPLAAGIAGVVVAWRPRAR
jgi:hypothetical protein